MTDPVPAAAPAHPRRTWGQRGVLTVMTLATVFSLLAAGVLYWGVQKFENIEEVAVESVSRAEEGEPSNWLLVGTDTREGIDEDDPNAAVFLGEPVSGKRTDTMIIARVDPVIGTIDLLSVPRDLYVPIAGTGSEGRVNTAFVGEGGGPDRLVATIETELGLEINHYLEVNFVGFQDIVDALGGVPMWFDTPMRDAGSGLAIETAGCHVLGGFDALAFARARKLEYFADGAWRSDGTGDLGRSTRQQYFLRQVAATAADRMDVTQLSTIDRVLNAGGENLIRDSSVAPGDLLDLARVFRNVPADQIRSHTLSVEGFTTSGGAAVLRLLEADSQNALAPFRGEIIEPVAAGAFPTEVLNGSGVSGQAGEAADGLLAEGFAVGLVGDAGEIVERTQVRYGAGFEVAAERVARQLVVDAELVPQPGLELVQVVTGSDWAGVRPTPADLGSVTAPPVPDLITPTTAAEGGQSTETTTVAAAPSTTSTTAQPGVVPAESQENTACA